MPATADVQKGELRAIFGQNTLGLFNGPWNGTMCGKCVSHNMVNGLAKNAAPRTIRAVQPAAPHQGERITKRRLVSVFVSLVTS